MEVKLKAQIIPSYHRAARLLTTPTSTTSASPGTGPWREVASRWPARQPRGGNGSRARGAPRPPCNAARTSSSWRRPRAKVLPPTPGACGETAASATPAPRGHGAGIAAAGQLRAIIEGPSSYHNRPRGGPPRRRAGGTLSPRSRTRSAAIGLSPERSSARPTPSFRRASPPDGRHHDLRQEGRGDP